MARSRTLFTSPLVSLGEFRCRPGDRRWHEPNSIGDDGHHLVFPGTAVFIAHEGCEPALADASVAVVYRSGERYRRALADRAGDHCVWVIPTPQLAPAVERLDADRSAARFRPAGRRAYAVQRLIASALAGGRRLDPLLVEEQLSAVVADTLDRALAVRPRGTACDAAAEQARAILASRYAEPLSLGDVAREVNASPYHLARRFRRLTGHTLHGYRNQIRLRRGLGLACEGERGLGRVAAEVGYSSHSHFTDSFRREFGLPPSWLRAAGPRELRTILEALPAARA